MPALMRQIAPWALILVVTGAVTLFPQPAGAMGTASRGAAPARTSTMIHVVAAENEYANVLSQIGGSHVAGRWALSAIPIPIRTPTSPAQRTPAPSQG